jgi:hypothetical protein
LYFELRFFPKCERARDMPGPGFESGRPQFETKRGEESQVSAFKFSFERSIRRSEFMI